MTTSNMYIKGNINQVQTFKGATIVHFPTLVIEGDFYPMDLKSLYAVIDILVCKGV